MSLNSKFKINTVFHVYVESKNNTNEQTQQNINSYRYKQVVAWGDGVGKERNR